jgi:hypothetical protein
MDDDELGEVGGVPIRVPVDDAYRTRARLRRARRDGRVRVRENGVLSMVNSFENQR